MPSQVRSLIALLQADGGLQLRHQGIHRPYRHAAKPGTVTAAGSPHIDMPPGTFNSVTKQAGLKGKDIA